MKSISIRSSDRKYAFNFNPFLTGNFSDSIRVTHDDSGRLSGYIPIGSFHQANAVIAVKYDDRDLPVSAIRINEFGDTLRDTFGYEYFSKQ